MMKQDTVYEVLVPAHVGREWVDSPEFRLNLSYGASSIKHIHYKTVAIPEKSYYFNTMKEADEFCSKNEYPFIYVRKRYLDDAASI